MYESPIMLFKTDQLIQCVKNEADTMIIRGVARAGVHVDKDELIKALEYDRGQYEKGFHDGRMYVPPCPSNADRIRAMSDEELASKLELIQLEAVKAYGNDEQLLAGELYEYWLNWLRQEAE